MPGVQPSRFAYVTKKEYVFQSVTRNRRVELVDALACSRAGVSTASPRRTCTSAARRHHACRGSSTGRSRCPWTSTSSDRPCRRCSSRQTTLRYGDAVEHQRVHGEQRVEPAARLVDRLADEVGGEAALEQRRRSRTGSGAARTASSPSRTTRRGRARRGAARSPHSGHAIVTSSTYGRCRSSSGGRGRPAPRARRPTRCRCRARNRRSATPGSACPSSGRATAPSRRCSRASRRSGRA